MSRGNSSSNATQSLAMTAAVTAAAAAAASVLSWWMYRESRLQWKKVESEESKTDVPDSEPSHSILRHFRDLKIKSGATVEEANKRRTVSYYEKAREAHLQELVPGVTSRSTLLQRRRAEMARIMRHWYEGEKKSHRTVVVMCDSTTSALLDEARRRILNPLNPTSDPACTSRGTCWIPECSMIPPRDMHVTVATPWWWHTIRPNNWALSRDLANRLRQTLLLKFHHPFQIELERIVLLGGKSLVALWRTVGERTTPSDDVDDEDSRGGGAPSVIYDRHGDGEDPFVRLREEIVRCFTTASPDNRREPLTYAHRVADAAAAAKEDPSAPTPRRPRLVRQNSIEQMTPGLGSGDGFIHTTLCRIPIDCLSCSDVELGEVHRLCREATATLAGHRMVVSKYRMVETTGKGGESNPCVDPIYDETIKAPTIMSVRIDGVVTEVLNLHEPKRVDATSTIGAERNFDRTSRIGSVVGLFDDPKQEMKVC